MLLLNFSHPLTPMQTAQLEALTGAAVERVLAAPAQFDPALPFAPQLDALLAEAPAEMMAPYRKAIFQVFNPVTIPQSPHPERRPWQIRLDKPMRGGYTYLS
jgi:hypothetical protein